MAVEVVGPHETGRTRNAVVAWADSSLARRALALAGCSVPNLRPLAVAVCWALAITTGWIPEVRRLALFSLANALA